MTNPITPPPELVQQWIRERPEREYSHTRRNYLMGISNYDQTARQFVFDIATQAAQWGADQELDACCEWIQEFYKTECWVTHDLKHFRAARRPKPPSLKEQALAALEDDDIDVYLIRRALEALDD